jgi:hypothetical protein
MYIVGSLLQGLLWSREFLLKLFSAILFTNYCDKNIQKYPVAALLALFVMVVAPLM